MICATAIIAIAMKKNETVEVDPDWLAKCWKLSGSTVGGWVLHMSAELQVSPLHLFPGSALKLNQLSVGHLSNRAQNVTKGDFGR
jgi:hypothetical protein